MNTFGVEIGQTCLNPYSNGMKTEGNYIMDLSRANPVFQTFNFIRYIDNARIFNFVSICQRANDESSNAAKLQLLCEIPQ